MLADVTDLPSFAHEWKKHHEAARLHASSALNTNVLIALYLDAYQALPRHEPGWLARCLGLSLQEESGALDDLQRAGLVELVEGRYRCLPEDVLVSFDGTPEEEEARKRWIRRQVFVGKRLHEAHTVALVSHSEARQIKAILREATQKIFRIAANTDATETMIKLNVLLTELGVEEVDAPLYVEPDSPA